MTQSTRMLRLALLIDAGASLALGLVLALAAGQLAEPFGLSQGFLLAIGLVMLGWALYVFWLARQPVPPRRQAWAVVALNLLWVADSLVLLGFVSPTPLGTGFVLGQAGAVLVITLMQVSGLRRAPALA